MSNTALVWLLGGVAVVLGLFLLFATSAPAPLAEVAEAASEGEIGSEGAETASLEPATQSPVSYAVGAPGTYSACGGQQTVVVAAEKPTLVGGCFTPDTPCARRDCPVCPRPSSTSPIGVPEQVACGCVSPAVPCGQPDCPGCPQPAAYAPSPCEPLSRPACGVSSCGSSVDVCRPACAPFCPTRPGINRNVPTCVDECSFFQLNATIPQPVCSTVCYQWAATRGTLINATARDPLYFAPAVSLPCGEDVWITLSIVDAQGARYSDEIRLHVRNLP